MEEHQLEKHLQDSAAIVRLANPYMAKISSFVSPECQVILTDSDGYIVARRGNALPVGLGESAVSPGVIWNEECHGTNAIALVAGEKIPCAVVGEEHYLTAYRGLSASAAPIFGPKPEREFLGVLALVEAVGCAHPHTLGMIAAVATAIENDLELERTANQLDSVICSISDGLIAVNNDGVVTHLNSVAGRIFGLNPIDCVGQSVEDVFQGSFPLIQIFKTGREGFSDRELSVRFNGRRIHVTVSSSPIRSKQGEIFGVVITCREMRSVQRLVTRMVGAQARFTFADLIGNDPQFLEAIDVARRVSRSDSTVLIAGESGTGKELFAQAIHNGSPRRDGPFVAVNIAALPRNLVESELFGYEEGAFTGARRGGRPGKFELASGGTLFLDEIGDIPLEAQVSLLRVLQEKQVVRIGGHTPTPVHIRVLAATNRDISQLVKDGHFRLDLYYRLSVINLEVPPLRERGDDVLHLADHFLRQGARNGSQGELSMSEEVKQAFLSYHWPGNVRELENVIEYAVHMLDGDCVRLEHLPDHISCSQSAPFNRAPDDTVPSLPQAEEALIIHTLLECNGNVSQTAKSLGIGRTTLYRKMGEYEIDLDGIRKSDPL